ncbi:hypothetical protein NQ152_12630 [Microbacterium sp. zg.B48]|uniref:hypothetical protein n=1 Tax=Microbacterium sp. zg.B48 TaxID=2969408 RepID=UPI00214AFBE7|nr:hypothetical protein [Microbacterium sp. zg.B48]MCR2764349.1 hypothetical protein [Microbacterium sp. zg.B48]
MFYGETKGIWDIDLTAEEQLAHWDRLDSVDGFRVVDEGTAEYAGAVYTRAAELFDPRPDPVETASGSGV